MMDSASDTYHFRIDGDDPVDGVLEAVQFVKGRDALEIEPLGRVVDPEALEAVLSGDSDARVSFVIDDLQVSVTSAGDIHVTDPTPDSFIHESIAGASNLLLETDAHEHEACVDLLSVEPYGEESLLGVLHAESFETRVSAWDQYMDERPPETAAINVGDFPRSATAMDGGTETVHHREPVAFVPEAENLAELRAAITDSLSGLETADRQLVVCFDSITRLVRNVPRERAVRFLRSITNQMEQVDAVAHYHLDPDELAPETRASITPLFDAHVVVDEGGDWTVS